MKSVLISIKPKDCKLIANGNMTIKVLKSRPKIEAPFKCYIYCTLDKKREAFFSKEVFDGEKGKWAIPHVGNGKVIGEFVCNSFYGITNFLPYDVEDCHHSVTQGVLEQTCLEDYEIDEYLGKKDGYGWHISNLKIYDQPKELNQFSIPCKVTCENCRNPLYFQSLCKEKGKKILTRPPHSWCYISED